MNGNAWRPGEDYVIRLTDKTGEERTSATFPSIFAGVNSLVKEHGFAIRATSSWAAMAFVVMGEKQASGGVIAETYSVKPTERNNFCRVFELPIGYPSGYLFGESKPVVFQMVDWFYPIPQDDLYGDKVKPWSVYEALLHKFLEQKPYVKVGLEYLLMADFKKSFVFTKKGE